MTTADTDRPPDAALVRRPARIRILWLLVAVLALAVLMAASVALGSRDVAWSDVWAALGGADDSIEQAAVAKRIPRTLLAVLIGAALGLSGGVMQGVTRNPLADPGILGVNMGASLSVVTAVAFFGLTSPTGYIWIAMAGAALSAVFVYTVGSLGRGGATPSRSRSPVPPRRRPPRPLSAPSSCPATTSPGASGSGRSAGSAARPTSASVRSCRSSPQGSPCACCAPAR